MNILLITNNLYPSGGDWTYIKSVAEIYQRYGHQVYLWGQRNEKNVYHENEEYFVRRIDTSSSVHKLLNSIKIIKRSIYSKESYDNLSLFLNKFSIDIAQIDSINIGLTPSVIEALHDFGIPIVWRVMDYKMICPTIHLLRNNKICEDCFGHKYFNCVKQKCKNGSLSESVAVALETAINSKKPYYKLVNMMSFQNHFTQQLYKRWGFPINDSFVLNNPYDVSNITPNFNSGDYVLYFGKTDTTKGVMTLLQTAEINKSIDYVIVGIGTEDENIKSFIKEKKLVNVDFKGPVWGAEMEKLLDECSMVVVPSEWYEPSPYVILQAFAHGKPVVGSNLGGIPEMVKNGYNGSLFTAGDVDSLARIICELHNDRSEIERMGKNARLEVENFYSPGFYYQESMKIFESLLTLKE